MVVDHLLKGTVFTSLLAGVSVSTISLSACAVVGSSGIVAISMFIAVVDLRALIDICERQVDLYVQFTYSQWSTSLYDFVCTPIDHDQKLVIIVKSRFSFFHSFHHSILMARFMFFLSFSFIEG